MTGLYIHIPFCKSKCPYCDFYSVNPGLFRCSHWEKADGDRLMDAYTEALIREIGSFGTELPEGKGEPDGGSFPLEKTGNSLSKIPKLEADTVYFGGGTPNLLGNERLKRVLDAIFDRFTVKDPEITIEINPKTTGVEQLSGLRKMGFNRLSIGAQSFDDGVLKKLGRLHRAGDAEKAFEDARRAGFGNISLDLMFGIPGQTEEVWEASVKNAVSLSPEHLSLYSLEFMEGTRFTKLLEEGKLRETDPEDDRRMYESAVEMLRRAGYAQYEISNFAKPGFESRHNLKYWDLREYIGFGSGAHSYEVEKTTGQGRRSFHGPDIEKYLEDPTEREMCDPNSLTDDIEEFAITALRLIHGIDKREFHKRFGLEFWGFYGELTRAKFRTFIETGHAEENEERIRLTLKGLNISNQILELFV